MKSVIAGLLTAFSLYSAIPMPKTDWSPASMRYAMCFFPLIGVVTGALELLWFRVCIHFAVVPGLFAAMAVLLPIVVSGGIHMDGFIDTADAISSHALREKKLEILKDPHVGAFGVLFCAGQLLVSFGLWQQIYAKPRLILMIAAGYVISRCLSSFSVATITPAKDSGLVHLFSQNADRRTVILCNAVVAAILALFLLVTSRLWGAVAILAAAVCYLLHRRFCIWEFGGNTGDLAGFLLQNVELLLLIVAVVGGVWR